MTTGHSDHSVPDEPEGRDVLFIVTVRVDPSETVQQVREQLEEALSLQFGADVAIPGNVDDS